MRTWVAWLEYRRADGVVLQHCTGSEESCAARREGLPAEVAIRILGAEETNRPWVHVDPESLALREEDGGTTR